MSARHRTWYVAAASDRLSEGKLLFFAINVIYKSGSLQHRFQASLQRTRYPQ